MPHWILFFWRATRGKGAKAELSAVYPAQYPSSSLTVWFLTKPLVIWLKTVWAQLILSEPSQRINFRDCSIVTCNIKWFLLYCTRSRPHALCILHFPHMQWESLRLNCPNVWCHKKIIYWKNWALALPSSLMASSLQESAALWTRGKKHDIRHILFIIIWMQIADFLALPCFSLRFVFLTQAVFTRGHF